jgi:hypothetical protein
MSVICPISSTDVDSVDYGYMKRRRVIISRGPVIKPDLVILLMLLWSIYERVELRSCFITGDFASQQLIKHIFDCRGLCCGFSR